MVFDLSHSGYVLISSLKGLHPPFSSYIHVYIFGLSDQANRSDVADTRVYPEVSYRILLDRPLHFLHRRGLPDLKIHIE